ncbi:MAG TPA: sulfite:cytochrome C oxidoreductase subunit B [Campylobacterales bacterium]|nr:sulfite:cytochrome C oxidoreductase subunit B [Campylobacterales bacterium]
MKKLLLIALLAMSPLMAQVDEKVEVPYIDFPIKMGEDFALVQAHCLMCHSFGYIINQGKQSREHWNHVINKMIKSFKAPIPEENAKKIEDFLTEHYGNGK